MAWPLLLELQLLPANDLYRQRSPFFYDIKYGANKDSKINALEANYAVGRGPYSVRRPPHRPGAQFIGAGQYSQYPQRRLHSLPPLLRFCFRFSSRSPRPICLRDLMDISLRENGNKPRVALCLPSATPTIGQEPEVYSMVDALSHQPKYKAAGRQRDFPHEARRWRLRRCLRLRP